MSTRNRKKPSPQTAAPSKAAGSPKPGLTQTVSGDFTHGHLEGTAVSQQLRQFHKATPEDQALVLYDLHVLAETNDSKQEATFRATFVTLISVLVALTTLVLPQALQFLVGSNVSAQQVGQLEREMDGAFLELKTFAEASVAARAAEPSLTLDKNVLISYYNEAERTRVDYYEALTAYPKSVVSAVSSIALLALGLLLISQLWTRRRRDARSIDETRARAAAWIGLYSNTDLALRFRRKR